MRGATPPLPNTPSWRGAELKNIEITVHLPLSIFSGRGIKMSISMVFRTELHDVQVFRELKKFGNH
jgi:hypothetical protein